MGRHERVDDVPLILGVASQLRLAEALDEHLGNHGLNQGLSFGHLAVGWIAYILSQQDHAKYQVQDWANSLPHTLAHFFSQPPHQADFSDDRLGIVLRRLARADWHSLETRLWRNTLDVYELPLDAVRLDSTTQRGHHQVHKGGLMQLGVGNGPPGLPQLKVMAGCVQPSGYPLAGDVHPGNNVDDPLYLPTIHRLRDLTGKTGLLYCGDCKMAALATRADIVAAKDHYLCRLPRSNDNIALIDGCIEGVLSGEVPAVRLLDEDGKEFALAGETQRAMTAVHDGEVITWQERVQLIRPDWLWQHHQEQLAKRLAKAEQALRALTPPIGPGKVQIRDEGKLKEKVEEVLSRHEVAGLLLVSWQKEQQRVQRRGKKGQRGEWVMLPRYEVTQVWRDQEGISRLKERLGWQTQVTSVGQERLGLAESVKTYGEGYCQERAWNWLKNRPLGLGPMWVWKEEQMLGLVRLLMVALRLLTYIQLRARDEMAKEKEPVRGTYAGQPGRRDKTPSAARLLGGLCRARVSLIGVKRGQEVSWQLVGTPPWLGRLLAWLGLPPGLYSDLARPPGAAGEAPRLGFA
jgi:transposase